MVREGERAREGERKTRTRSKTATTARDHTSTRKHTDGENALVWCEERIAEGPGEGNLGAQGVAHGDSPAVVPLSLNVVAVVVNSGRAPSAVVHVECGGARVEGVSCDLEREDAPGSGVGVARWRTARAEERPEIVRDGRTSRGW